MIRGWMMCAYIVAEKQKKIIVLSFTRTHDLPALENARQLLHH